MTIDDMPRTFDISADLATGPAISAVPDLTLAAPVLNTRMPAPSDVVREPKVHVGQADPSTGVICGTVVVDGQGHRTAQFGPALFTTDKGGLVSVEAQSGRFSYTPSVQAQQVARLSRQRHDTIDTFTVNVVDGSGRSHDMQVVVDIVAGNAPPTGAARVALPQETGVVLGRIQGAAWDGSKLTFSLANSSNPQDSTAESAYSAKGGLVQLDTGTGRFAFVPRISDAEIPGRDTDRFVVTAIDARGGTVDVTVEALAHLKIGVVTTSTAPGVQCGRLAISPGGPLSYSVGDAPSQGSVLVREDGSYVYTRNPNGAYPAAADDSFTIVGTDGFGRSITVAVVAVSPPPHALAVVASNRDPWKNSPIQSTVGASGRATGLATGDWTTSIANVNGDDISYTVHQPTPRGFVMMARTAPGKWAVHYESMSPKVGARHLGETFTVRYHAGGGDTTAFAEATYEF